MRRRQPGKRLSVGRCAGARRRISSRTSSPMIELVWTRQFSRICRRWRREHPELAPVLRERLELFEREPWHSSLRTHSLSGQLKGLWAIRITYDHRLVFQFVDDAKTGALLVDIGTHDEVY